MCGIVSNWAAAFSPTDEECRDAWDNNTVTCGQPQSDGADPDSQQPAESQQESRAYNAPLLSSQIQIVRGRVPRYEPRVPKGRLLAARLLAVSLVPNKLEKGSFRVTMTNSLRSKLVLEGIAVQVTDRSGRTASLDIGGEEKEGDRKILAKSSCSRLLGSELQPGWESVCEFTLFDSSAPAAALVKVSARGTQSVRGGYHPVLGAAAL